MSDAIDLLRRIFADAAEIQDPEARARFLAGACGTDRELRCEVEELLQAAAASDGFLPGTPVGRDARSILFGLEGTCSPVPAQAAPASENEGDRIGRYKLLQKIGEGGCGVVYLAEQEEPVRRKVALKVIKLGMDTRQVVARFEAERQALALMDHPNIARVLDAGATTTGRPFFVMELVRGIKITHYCDQHTVGTRQRLELFIQVCQAVQHAHQKGVIHRDLKPSNILVTENDGVAVPKVIDFGIAKATEGRLTDQTLFTAFDQFLGTPAYMSPEQAALTSVDVDTRSDIYSLGVLLYELLTGRTPFDTQALLAVGLDEMRRTIREQAPQRPSALVTTMAQGELSKAAGHRGTEAPKLVHYLRGDLDWIVMKCLEKDRKRRYETANGLANDLRRHLNCEPVVARPPSRLYEFQTTVRRHTFGFAAVGVVMVTLAIGAVVSRLEAVRAHRAEQEQARLGSAAVAAEQGMRRESYARAMLLGYEALQAGDYDVVREVLGQTRAFATARDGTNGGPRVPAWEWRRLAYEARDGAAFRLASCAGVVQSLAVSSDGQWLASGDSAGHVSLWRRPAHDVIARWPMGANVVRLAFSPDSRCLAAGCWDGTLRILGIPSGKTNAEFRAQDGILQVRFSPDGHRVAFASNSDFSIADAETGAVERSVSSPWANGVAVSPDFQTVVRAPIAGGLVFCRGGTNLTLSGVAGDLFGGHGHEISPDGRWLATALADHSVEIWSLQELRAVRRLLGHTKAVLELSWSADSRLLAGSGSDQTICIWDVARGRLLRCLRGHDGPVETVVFSPDGRLLFSGGKDTSIRAWTSLEVEPQPDALPMVPGTGSASFAGGGRYLCACTPLGPRLVETSPAWRIYDFLTGPGSLYGLSADARWVATTYPQSNLCQLLRRDTNGLVLAASHPGVTRSDLIPVFSRDAHRLAIAGTDGRVEVWDIEPWRLAARWEAGGLQAGVGGLLFDPPGRRLFVRDFHKDAAVGEVASGRWMWFHEEHQDPDNHISSLDVSPDNRMVVTCSYRGTVLLWTCAPGEEPRPLRTITRHSAGAWSVAFSPDGRYVAVGGFDGGIELWDLRLGMLVSTLKGHRQPVWALAFNPEDDSLVSVSPEEVRVWRVNKGGG